MYCQHCGSPVDQVAEEIAHAAAESEAVTLARIDADRAIQVAKIEAGAVRAEVAVTEAVAEIEADAAVDAAEVQADVIGAAIEASDLPPAEPLEFIAPDIINDVDVVDDDSPPETEGSPVPDAPAKASFGAW
jgi:hypothetical protein